MNIPNSSIKYPNYLTGIQTAEGAWFKGGYSYQAREGDTGGWTRRMIINEILQFSGADLTGSYPETGHFVADPLVAWEFPNGYKIKVNFETLKHPTYITVLATVNLYDTADQAVGNIANVYNAYSTYNFALYGDTEHLPSVEGNSAVLFSVVLNTEYYPDAYPAADTANRGIGLGMIVGNTAAGFVIHTGNVEGWTSQGGFGQIITLGSFLNLNDFNTYLHSHGNPFDGDMFTDEPIPEGPAGESDNSRIGGGAGNYDDTSDTIDFPALPTGGAIASGAVRAFRVSTQTLEAIQAKLWDDSIFNFSTWQKVIEQPMSAIVDLFMLPFSPEVEQSGTNIYVGNFNTGVTAPKVTSDYVMIDCGSLEVSEYWGSALDYSPYTHVEIFLPFIGVRKLTPEDVMGSTVAIKYAICVLTGDCIAYIKCGQSVLYHYNGNCKQRIPLTGTSSDALKSNIQSMVSATGAAVGGTGLMGAGVAAVGAGSAAAPALVAGGVAISAASAVAGSKVKHERTGDISGAAGLMDDFVPYLIIHRPKQSLAKGYNQFKGYPSNISSKLSTCKGYTEVEHVHLKGISGATDRELSDIEMLLKTGVII